MSVQGNQLDNGEALAKLIIIKGLASQTYLITSDSVSIGRALTNDFGINADGISRVHARISKKPDGYYLQDLGSTNGTFLNGDRISTEIKLRHGDVIQLGRAVGLSFDMPEGPKVCPHPSPAVHISCDLNPAIQSTIDSGEKDDIPRLIRTTEIPADVQFLRRAYQRLALLYQVNSLVGSLMDIEKLLDRMGNIVLNLKKADRVAILLQGDDADAPVPAVVKLRMPCPDAPPMQVSLTIVRKVLAEGVGILSGNVPDDPHFDESRSIEIQNIRSVICAPLRRKEKVIGAIYVDCLSSGEGFDKEDLKLLVAVSNEASIALENAYSYREIEDLNKRLEEKVKDRTADLEQALEDLKNAQLQLIQSERFSAMGELMASIAHEINNPVNCIINGVESLNRYVRELRWINERYDEAARRAGVDLSEMDAFSKNLNFPAHMTLLNEVLSAIRESAMRTGDILESLRGFSRSERTDIREIDINEIIESSVRVLSHALRQRVEVSMEKGSLPPLRCYSSQIGQVFVNLLNNAQQAIEQSGRISIKTWSDDAALYVSVSDTGRGISAEVIPRIFEPFFTTKGEGQGMGLGLAISLSIVKRHGGKIEVWSSPGSGTTFTVLLPREGIPSDMETTGERK